MFKKAFALILALACCFALLVGCGGDSTDNTKRPGKNPALENYEAPDLTGVTLTQYMTRNTDYNPDGCWRS